jgi:putative ABC transport system permease protein
MPDWKDAIRKQLAGLHLAPTREAEIVEELAQHAEDRYRELQSGGATEPEGRRVTLDELVTNCWPGNCVPSSVRTPRNP